MVKRRSPEPNMLLVEGEEDKRVIPELMQGNGVPWGKQPPVFIEARNGFESMVRPDVIATELKASGLKALGIVADANEHAEQRWKSLRNRCLGSFPDLPDDLPARGLIEKTESGLKLGVWLMPDNQSHGMMETFLTYLVPDERNPVLEYAQSARDEAKSLGAPYSDVHADKAKIYTWLAWQDPPGRQLHNAVMKGLFNSCSPRAADFVGWFRSLFEL